jgi:hypothetical protein
MKKIVSFWILFLLTVVSAEAAKQPRSFYLTEDGFTGAQASTACADGYHMASLWEIFNPSNLEYDTTLGLTSDDSGFGPPTTFYGWIRTGFSSNADGLHAGVVNCFTWTSDSSLDLGSMVRLMPFWGSPQSLIDPWDGFISVCSTARNVWCVQD